MNQRIMSAIIVLCAIISCAIILVFATCAHATRAHKERWYQEQWCAEHGGQTEVVMNDGTRCDCVLETHAIEFDFGAKWAESLAQALNYAMQTGKRAGIVLILENGGDVRYVNRLRRVIEFNRLAVDVWVMR